MAYTQTLEAAGCRQPQRASGLETDPFTPSGQHTVTQLMAKRQTGKFLGDTSKDSVHHFTEVVQRKETRWWAVTRKVGLGVVFTFI